MLFEANILSLDLTWVTLTITLSGMETIDVRQVID
jgi:hypothetical protein